MFTAVAAFSGFSVDDGQKAKEFYTNTLGLQLADETMGLMFSLPDGGSVFIYEKDDHQAATYTVLNFVVDDIDASVDVLTQNGVTFERYDDMPGAQDEKGIIRGGGDNPGPSIAWFKDPAGNILALIQK
ncbi:MAG: VOC family protein [Candidatus Saccharibacteria bacterium]|nr:VOC family protein [Candidatus Saccharibacteria bacterium]